MNVIWGMMIVLSFVCAVINGRVEETINAVFEGAQSAAATIISLGGIMCFWTGIMRVAEKSGLSCCLQKCVAPWVYRLFPNVSDTAREYIALNLAANVLGMGNAATPMGMLAAEKLDSENATPNIPSRDLCMLVVLNTTSFQLVPTTIISLRAACGAANAASVIAPIWFASAVSVAVGVISVKVLVRDKAVSKKNIFKKIEKKY